VLDIGSGPGTLAIPLAKQVRAVTAVDFSEKMLAELNNHAQAEKLANITSVQASWEDDWQNFGIIPHDIVIASRSLSVNDLKAALEKLNHWAKQKVFIGDRVGSGPFDPDIFAAVGREFRPGPDYIFTVNLLYQMGINAHVDFITASRSKTYKSREEAFEACAWMINNVTEEERGRLEAFLDDRLIRKNDSSWELTRRQPPQWALIWWSKQ